MSLTEDEGKRVKKLLRRIEARKEIANEDMYPDELDTGLIDIALKDLRNLLEDPESGGITFFYLAAEEEASGETVEDLFTASKVRDTLESIRKRGLENVSKEEMRELVLHLSAHMVVCDGYQKKPLKTGRRCKKKKKAKCQVCSRSCEFRHLFLRTNSAAHMQIKMEHVLRQYFTFSKAMRKKMFSLRLEIEKAILFLEKRREHSERSVIEAMVAHQTYRGAALIDHACRNSPATLHSILFYQKEKWHKCYGKCYGNDAEDWRVRAQCLRRAVIATLIHEGNQYLTYSSHLSKYLREEVAGTVFRKWKKTVKAERCARIAMQREWMNKLRRFLVKRQMKVKDKAFTGWHSETFTFESTSARLWNDFCVAQAMSCWCKSHAGIVTEKEVSWLARERAQEDWKKLKVWRCDATKKGSWKRR